MYEPDVVGPTPGGNTRTDTLRQLPVTADLEGTVCSVFEIYMYSDIVLVSEGGITDFKTVLLSWIPDAEIGDFLGRG